MPKLWIPLHFLIKTNSLRGDNRFVQMAIWNIDNGKDEFPNEYAYNESDDQGNLTMSIETICGYGDSNKNLFEFMAKNTTTLKKVQKKPIKTAYYLVKQEAQNPQFI